MSTPLHHQPNDNVVKGNHRKTYFTYKKLSILESLSNELDREIEHELQKLNTTTTIKRVTIVEPPTRPSASVDDFTRTNKTISGSILVCRDHLTIVCPLDCLTTTSDTTRDLNMLHNAYKQNLSSMPTTRTVKAHTFDPKKKIQPQKPIGKLEGNDSYLPQ